MIVFACHVTSTTDFDSYMYFLDRLVSYSFSLQVILANPYIGLIQGTVMARCGIHEYEKDSVLPTNTFLFLLFSINDGS